MISKPKNWHQNDFKLGGIKSKEQNKHETFLHFPNFGSYERGAFTQDQCSVCVRESTKCSLFLLLVVFMPFSSKNTVHFKELCPLWLMAQFLFIWTCCKSFLENLNGPTGWSRQTETIFSSFVLIYKKDLMIIFLNIIKTLSFTKKTSKLLSVSFQWLLPVFEIW